jgi:hypothetical protein
MNKRKFVFYFWFIRFSLFSLGISIDVKSPNLEIHIPFGFFRIGWERADSYDGDLKLEGFIQGCVRGKYR